MILFARRNDPENRSPRTFWGEFRTALESGA